MLIKGYSYSLLTLYLATFCDQYPFIWRTHVSSLFNEDLLVTGRVSYCTVRSQEVSSFLTLCRGFYCLPEETRGLSPLFTWPLNPKPCLPRPFSLPKGRTASV